MFPDKKKEGKKSAQTIKPNIRQLHLCWWCRWQGGRWLRGTIWLRMWVNPGFTPYFPDHMPSLVITLPNTEIYYSTTWALRIIKGAQVDNTFQHKVTLVRSLGENLHHGSQKDHFYDLLSLTIPGDSKRLSEIHRGDSQRRLQRKSQRRPNLICCHYLFPFNIRE